MKHLRLLLPLLILALVLSGCAGEPQPYEYTAQGITVWVDPAAGTILHNGETISYTMDVGSNSTRYQITYPDGSQYYWTAVKYGGSGGWSDDYQEWKYLPGDFLVDALEQSVPREKQGNVGMGLLMMGVGAVNFFHPELPFYLKYGWRFANAEPSDIYLTFTKIGGAIVAVAGLVYCFI